jgi:glycosyltransferase involved in cell wall biosynthesis
MKTMRKLRVALVMPNHADLNSSLNNYVKTYQHLVKRRLIEVTLFTDQKNTLRLEHIHVEKIRGVDYGTILGDALLVLGIPRFYYCDLGSRLKDYDVIVANNPEFYAYAYQAYKAAKKHGRCLVLRTSQTVEGFFMYKAAKYIVNPVVRGAYAYASWNVFSNPEAEERCYRLGLLQRGKKVLITGHATDTACFKPLKVRKPSYPVVLSVGGLYKLKGHHYIMKALEALHRMGFPNAELWIVGKGKYEYFLREHAKMLGVADKVKFLGSQSHEQLAKTYNKSSVFVLANEQEVTPAVNEALACGIPVVMMECGGVSFVVSHGEEGLISRKYDIKDMAEKIAYVLKNKEKAAVMVKNGRNKILSQFSIEKVAAKMYRAFGG